MLFENKKMMDIEWNASYFFQVKNVKVKWYRKKCTIKKDINTLPS